MGTLENTYCKNTKDNLRRYQETGWTHIEKLDEKDGEFIIARIVMGREICHVINKESNLLNHLLVYGNLRLIEDAKEDVDYGIINVTDLEENKAKSFLTSLVFDEFGMYELDKMNTISIVPDVNNDTKKYTYDHIVIMLEHILSFQTGSTFSTPYVYTDIMVKELARFGFHVNPQGKNIEGK